jgi:uncharacterized sporulation protein YeaH/YhbH (DUF444 family)
MSPGLAYGGGVRETDLWRTYKSIAEPVLAMRRVTQRREIYPVFRELFAKDGVAQQAEAGA